MILGELGIVSGEPKQMQQWFINSRRTGGAIPEGSDNILHGPAVALAVDRVHIGK